MVCNTAPRDTSIKERESPFSHRWDVKEPLEVLRVRLSCSQEHHSDNVTHQGSCSLSANPSSDRVAFVLQIKVVELPHTEILKQSATLMRPRTATSVHQKPLGSDEASYCLWVTAETGCNVATVCNYWPQRDAVTPIWAGGGKQARDQHDLGRPLMMDDSNRVAIA